MANLKEKLVGGLMAASMMTTIGKGVQDVQAIQDEYYDETKDHSVVQTLTPEEMSEYNKSVDDVIEEVQVGLTAGDDLLKTEKAKEELEELLAQEGSEVIEDDVEELIEVEDPVDLELSEPIDEEPENDEELL